MNSKTTKPPDDSASGGLQELSNGAWQYPFNTPNQNAPQAPCPADTTGEDDWTYFRARPGTTTRTRFPFEDEFPCHVLLPGRCAFVRVSIDRADGQLKRRRRLRFCEGGTA